MAKTNKNGKSPRNSREMREERDSTRGFRSNRSSRGNRSSGSNPDVDSKSTYPSGNNFEWWSKNPELLASVARVPFPNKPGMELDVGTEKKFRIPGVMTFKYVPSFGFNESPIDPINVAAREIYGVIRSNFSASLDADAPDIMMYIMALGQIHAALSGLRRIYRLINTQPQTNYDYPSTFFKSWGMNLDDLMQHKVEFWGEVNLLTHMANKWLLPASMPYFARMCQLEENIYADEAIDFPQTYVFRPISHWMVKPDTSTGTALTSVDIDYSTWDGVLKHTKALIEAMSEWDDSYTIQGYMLKAFGSTPMFTSPLLGAEETQTFVYDIEMLSQIENATILTSAPGWNLGISQDPNTNVIKTNLYNNAGMDVLRAKPVNLHTALPTARDVVEATRLRVVPDESSDRDNVDKIVRFDCGTEAILGTLISRGPNMTPYEDVFKEEMIFDANTTTGADQMLNVLSIVRSFKHAPIYYMRLTRLGKTDNVDSSTYVMCDVENVATISNDDMRNLHRVCLYSALNCFNK